MKLDRTTSLLNDVLLSKQTTQQKAYYSITRWPLPVFLSKRTTQQKKRSHSSGKQSGQALIVILAFSAILGAGLLSIYNTAQVTTAKRELVNAADAAAYSGASIIAQGLNYTAYTNRAILANNALIGQMTAMRSTLAMSEQYWKSTEAIWSVIALIFALIPGLDVIVATIAEAAGKFSEYWNKTMVTPVKIFAEVLQMMGIASIGLTNQVMWLSQQIMLADSLAGFEPNMIKIAKDNAPDANVDPFLHATAFGPVVTLGMFASQFKIKKRSSERTQGTEKGPKDEYLNYVTGTNRIYTPPYLGGRNLIPNAIGLWIAKGCGVSLTSGLISAALAPAAGLGKGMDNAVRIVEAFGAILGIAANPVMCLYDRQGGSELVQLDDGKMAWVSIDAMAFKIPIVDYHVPIAGGAVMSFTETDNDKYKASLPGAVDKFRTYANGSDPKKLMGHQNALPADCVEQYVPGFGLVAISTDGRTSGTCALLATGFPAYSVNQGLWGGDLKDTTNKIIDSTATDHGNNYANEMQAIGAPLEQVMGAAVADLEVAMNGAAPPAISQTGASHAPAIPPGVTGGSNTANTALPDTAGLTSMGDFLNKSSWMNSMNVMSLSTLEGRLQFTKSDFKIDAVAVLKAAVGASVPAAGQDGGLGWFKEIILEVLGLGAVVDLAKLKISNGVEKPRWSAINKIFNTLADGLPPYFWDVRITDKVQDAPPGEAEDLVFTDDKPDDYNARLYNLGPVVYLPLKQNMDKVKTAANLGIGGSQMGLPDYDQVKNRKEIRAIGKARIFFRQPSDHWSNKYKIRINSSLAMPYWQVRNESLSYADKWGLIALDAVASPSTLRDIYSNNDTGNTSDGN